MLNHPIIRSKYFGIGYLVVWLLVFLFNLVVDAYYSGLAFGQIFGNNLVYSLVFALMGIPLWFIVSSCKRVRSMVVYLVNHVTIATVFVLVWAHASLLVVRLMASPDQLISLARAELNPFILIVGSAGYIILVMAYYLYIYYEDLQHKLKNEIQLQNSLREAEISMLKAQINPHFLFNSLNSVSSLTMVDALKAQDMVVKLSDYLRYTVSNSGSAKVPLRQELENTHRYLDIEKVRFGSKLQYQFDIAPAAMECKLPAMLLQPIYENAIKHGVYESTEPISIVTKAVATSESMVITISNNYQAGAPMHKGEGIGLRNISERLKLEYQNEKLLRVRDSGAIFEVTVIIPLKKDE